MAIGLKDVFADAASVASELNVRLSSVGSACVEKDSAELVIFRITFFPEDVFAREGFPVEEARVYVFSDGRVLSSPASGPGRTWKHRNILGVGDLCLWYPDDPRELRWEWEDGLEEHLRILHRHLIYEEINRRTGWPVEDAPHGVPESGSWPIRTREMRGALRRPRR